jgi:hypothetical protein
MADATGGRTMDHPDSSRVTGAAAGARAEDRIDHDGGVRIEFVAGAICGSGQNVSSQGIFFVADASVPVAVRVDGAAQPMFGHLVRLESMGDGKFGIAVRFNAPQPQLVD